MKEEELNNGSHVRHDTIHRWMIENEAAKLLREKFPSKRHNVLRKRASRQDARNRKREINRDNGQRIRIERWCT